MLRITNLHASVDDREILKGLNLEVGKGEVHAIMGPNGSGKSTLAQAIAGRDDYRVTSGEIELNGESLLDLEPEERAALGVFLAFQYPVEIPGVTNKYFLRAAVNALREARGQEKLKLRDFKTLLQEKMQLLNVTDDLLERSINEGFSGGEKKRNEVFQMAVLDPKVCVLDETDSGLDIDALKVVANGVNTLRDGERSFVVVTHYQRLLEHIVPDCVHVLAGGRIVRSGGRELAVELEREGYAFLEDAVTEATADEVVS